MADKRGGQQKKAEGGKAKKLFFAFLDSVILLSFSLSVYFTYFQDYIRTIMFLVIGTLLLMFFIVRGILKGNKRE